VSKKAKSKAARKGITVSAELHTQLLKLAGPERKLKYVTDAVIRAGLALPPTNHQ